MSGLDQVIDGRIQEIWEKVIHTCNRVLHQANYHGFELMHKANPNVHEVARTLEHIICPLLDEIVRNADISPDSGVRMANIRQYTLHLREMTIALDNGDQQKFNGAVSALDAESMLF